MARRKVARPKRRVTIPRRTVTAPQPAVATIDHARITALLSQSRAAHDRKRTAAGLTDKDGKITSHPNYQQAEAEMREALRLRLEAHDLDPDHASPAWPADQLANKGLTHAQLCDWMREYETIP